MKRVPESDLENRRQALMRAYDPERFVQDAHEATELLRDHLRKSQDADRPVLPNATPAAVLEDWPDPEAGGGAALKDMLKDILEASTAQHHPGFVGQQLSAPPPLVAPVAMASTLLNNSVAIFEGAPVGVALERRLVSWMIQKVGYPEGAGGTLTSGGTLGALTALLAMRQAKVGVDAWGAGLASGQPVAIFATDQAHYCNARSSAILGLGADAIVPVPADSRYRMDVGALPGRLQQAQAAGRRPVALIASAGSTSTGSHDDLTALAAFCRDHGLWFHVDAAHGGGALLSRRHAHRLAGIEQADSLVWDAHKMMLMPGLCTAVLVRKAAHLDAAFRQDASYLLSAEAPWYQPAARNFETTKPTMAFPLYITLRTLGADFLAEALDYAYDLADAFAAEVQEHEAFELLTRPESNIVCFRRRISRAGTPNEENDALQERLRAKVNSRGRFFIQRTRHADETWLRIVVMNPATRLADLRSLLRELAEYAEPGERAEPEATG